MLRFNILKRGYETAKGEFICRVGSIFAEIWEKMLKLLNKRRFKTN